MPPHRLPRQAVFRNPHGEQQPAPPHRQAPTTTRAAEGRHDAILCGTTAASWCGETTAAEAAAVGHHHVESSRHAPRTSFERPTACRTQTSIAGRIAAAKCRIDGAVANLTDEVTYRAGLRAVCPRTGR